jgi:hypothetical protein
MSFLGIFDEFGAIARSRRSTQVPVEGADTFWCITLWEASHSQAGNTGRYSLMLILFWIHTLSHALSPQPDFELSVTEDYGSAVTPRTHHHSVYY